MGNGGPAGTTSDTLAETGVEPRSGVTTVADTPTGPRDGEGAGDAGGVPGVTLGTGADREGATAATCGSGASTGTDRAGPGRATAGALTRGAGPDANGGSTRAG